MTAEVEDVNEHIQHARHESFTLMYTLPALPPVSCKHQGFIIVLPPSRLDHGKTRLF